MRSTAEQRILALDLHPRSFAFVVLEGPQKLLDWGGRQFRNGRNAVRVEQGPKLARILLQYAPNMLLVTRRRRRTGLILAVMKEEALARGIPVRVVSKSVIEKAFEGQGGKYEIAASIAARFPELCAVLPPKRKPWQSEGYGMSIFDAAAVAIAFVEKLVPEPTTPSSAQTQDRANLSNGPRG